MICTVNAGHRIAHAETQRRDARRVHLVGNHVDAAEDDLVEGVGRERLAQQQRPPAGDGEIDRRERARPSARADERRAAAVDDVDRTRRYSAAVGRVIACDGTSPDGLPRGQFLGREIIDRDGGGDRLRRGMQLRRLGIVDQRLPLRLVDVAHARAAHALAQRLGRDDEREGALEARDPVVADAVEDIDGEALARGRGLEQNVGAGLRQPVGRTATARAERQHQEAQQPRRRPVGKLAKISSSRASMVAKPLCMHHATSGRSASWRPSSSSA